MSRTPSVSSRTRSSSSADRTSNTSYSHMTSDGRYKGKGKAQDESPFTSEESSPFGDDYDMSRSHPLSGKSWDNRASSSKRTIHPYPLSHTGAGRIRSVLSSYSLGLGGKKRILQLALALSIPILGLLLANEIRISHNRAKLYTSLPDETRTNEWEALDFDTPPTGIVDLRRGYEKKRRRELWHQKREGGSYMPILPSAGQMDWRQDDEERLKQEIVDWWPAWWGSSDIGGESPYDHTPGPVKGDKKRVLFLTSYQDYLERMNTHTYEIVDAALRHPNIVTDVWGPGWKGWNNDLTMSVNVQRRARRVEQLERSKSDHAEQVRLHALAKEKAVARQATWAKWTLGLVSGYLPDDSEIGDWTAPDWLQNYGEECGSVRWEVVWTISDIFKQWDTHLDVLTCGALLVQQLGDCHEFRCFKEWYPQANNITLSKYAFELEEIFSYDRVKETYPDWQMGIFGHSPDTGNEWDFYPLKWSEKVRDATMFGFDGSFYPIRTTITDRHNAHNGDESIPEPLVQHHRHPGYTVSTDPSLWEDRLETYTTGHWSYETHRRLREDFAQGMREARICVFDSSLERKLIRKYAQAFLSGCVVAGDIPTEHEAPLSKFMIRLQPSWTFERIELELRRYLADPEKLQQMALEGFIYARRYLTSTRKIDDVLGMAEAYREGVRGYEYPYSFSLKCRSYWSNEHAYRPPWCEPESYRGLEA